jgi:hypothetical protein
VSIKRLFDAVERRGDIGRRVAALVLPISNRPRVTSSCAGKIGLREPGEHTSGPNLASRDNVAHNQNLYAILEPPMTKPTITRRLLPYCYLGHLRPRFCQSFLLAMSGHAGPIQIDLGVTPSRVADIVRPRGCTREWPPRVPR